MTVTFKHGRNSPSEYVDNEAMMDSIRVKILYQPFNQTLRNSGISIHVPSFV